MGPGRNLCTTYVLKKERKEKREHNLIESAQVGNSDAEKIVVDNFREAFGSNKP